jgi:uncharacterized metal-binding protein YceD (DUF177 family)
LPNWQERGKPLISFREGDPMSALKTVPLDWVVAVVDVPARGLAWKTSATAEERKRIATDLDLRDLASLTAEGHIGAVAGGGYRLKATLRARVIQDCVITLEPVASELEEAVRIEFRPEQDVDEELKKAPDIEAEYDIEPINNGELETGRVVFEQLSASLDPYPRAPGAGLPDGTIAAPKGAAPLTKPNPFAVLAKLKDKS